MPDVTAKTVRQDAATRLGRAGLRVFDSRSTPIDDSEALPLVRVYTQEGSDDLRSMQGPIFDSTAELVIVGTVLGANDAAAAAACDDLEQAVKDVLFTDPDWVRQFEAIKTATGRSAVSSKGKRRLAEFELTLTVGFASTYEPAGATVVPFRRVHIKTDLAPADGRPESEIGVELP